MAEESCQTVVVALVDHILPLDPNLIDKLRKGINVLDIGCGKGRAINVMANHFKNSNFYGYDLSQEAIDGATREAQRMGNSNAFFKVRDILDLNFNEKYGLITAFDAIHNQPDPYSVLRSIYNSLDDKGIFLMQDILASTSLKGNIGHPLGPFLYTISCIHCVSVSLSQNGAGFGAMWGKEKATEMLNDVGFTDVEIKKLPHDFQNYYYIAYKNK